MKRKNFPQITQSSWFPSFLSQMIFEFMTWFVNKVGAAKPFLPIIEEGLSHASQIIVLDTRSGAGFETVNLLIDGHIGRMHADVHDFKGDSHGLHLSVNGFHQLNISEARALLATVYQNRQPIVVVEGNNDSLWQVFGMTVIVPLTVLFTACFVQPFRWERLLFTYVIPILPIVTLVDGCLALFKLYAPDDLDELTQSVGAENYVWRSGKMDNGRGGKIIYLIGYPIGVPEKKVK